MKFFETSAKNNINVEKAFFEMAREVLKRIVEQESQDGGAGGGAGKIKVKEEAPQSGGGGCKC
jgi:hypothetical protein